MARYNAGLIPPPPYVVSGVTAFGTHINPLILAVMSSNSGTVRPDAAAPGLVYSKEISGGYIHTMHLGAWGEAEMGTVTTADNRWRVGIGSIEDALVTSGRGVPTGTVIHVAMSGAPAGYLPADGSAVSRTTYAALFAQIGTTHGIGDGSTTFNLPDARNRSILGNGSRAVGVTGGAEVHNLTVAELAPHTHGPGSLNGSTSSAGAHPHDIPVSSIDSGGEVLGLQAGGNNIGVIATGSAGTHDHSTTITGGETASVGSGAGHNNMHPFLVLFPCIKF